MERDEPADSSLDQRQLDDLAALRAAAARRRGLVPGTEAHQAALAEERSIAKRIRTWASRPTANVSGPAEAWAAGAEDPSAASTPAEARSQDSMSAEPAERGPDAMDEA